VGLGTAQVGAQDFTEDRDLTETGSQVVVQIAGNPCAQAPRENISNAIGVAPCGRDMTSASDGIPRATVLRSRTAHGSVSQSAGEDTTRPAHHHRHGGATGTAWNQ
jgi:hypothetical protein